MKVRSLLLTALAASTVLVSCDKEENGANDPIDAQPKSVTVKLPNIRKSATRAVGDAMEHNSQVALENYKVFFVDAAEAEVEVPKWQGEDQQVYFSADDESWTGAGGEMIYHFLPSATAKVVVVGNLGPDITYAELGTLTQQVQNDDASGHPYYPLYGASALARKTGADDNDDIIHENVYTASVTLAPRISRFEIYGFEYAAGSTAYTSVKLQKIALNHYYKSYDFVSMKPDEADENKVWFTPTASTVWDWIDAQTAPWADALSVELNAGDKKYVDGTTIEPDDAPNGEEAENIITYGLAHVQDKQNNPELLVSLLGVNGSVETPVYLRGLFSSTTSTTPAFEAGKIYRVLFSFDDKAFQQPERCVELSVNVADWVVVPVTPDFNN